MASLIKNFLLKFHSDKTRDNNFPIISYLGDKNAPKNKTVVITSGVDGDEYEAIDANFKLINTLSNINIDGQIIIIPIVNQPGFIAKTNYNPIDSKHIKFIYPGNKSGSSSEQIAWELYEKYLIKCHFWIDLHGGSLDEELVPFVYSFQTNNKNINLIREKVMDSFPTPRILNVPAGLFKRMENIASDNIFYTVFEAGYGGIRKKEDVDSLHDWTIFTLNKLKFINININKNKFKTITYQKPFEYYCPHKLVRFMPNVKAGQYVKKGNKLGTYVKIENGETDIIIARADGEVLWIKRGGSLVKNDLVICQGMN